MHIDPDAWPGIFALDHRGTHFDADASNLRERNHRAVRGDDRQLLQRLDAVPRFAREADVDRIARKTFDLLADGLAAEHRCSRLLDLLDREAVASRGHAIDLDADVAAGHDPVGDGG